MKKGIFLSLAVAALSAARGEEPPKTGLESIQIIENLVPFTDDWTSNVQKFLKTPIKKEDEEGEAQMRFWTPPIPDMLDSTVQDDDVNYDYIVIGCGSSGCPLAGTLSGTGDPSKTVLVLERGIPRSPTNTPQAMNIWGAGLAYTNPDIAQPFITQQGVRTFASSITGGQSSINLGQFVIPSDDYFQHLSDISGVSFDPFYLGTAKAYVTGLNGFDMPTSNVGEATAKAFDNANIPAYDDGTSKPGYSSSVRNGFYWLGQTTFLPQGDFPRDAADNLLFNPETQSLNPNLTLKTRQTVEKIQFDTESSPPTAKCVYYHATTKFDTAKNGKSISPYLPEPNYLFKPLAEAILDPIHAFDDAERAIFGMNVLKGGRRRVCVKPGGKIILAAGPIHSTTILYNSGIGPKMQVEGLGRSLIVEHPNLGQEIKDTVMIPVTTYLAEGPTVPYAAAGAIGETLSPREDTSATTDLAKDLASLPERVASSVGGVVDSTVKTGTELGKEAVESVHKILKNPQEAVTEILNGNALNSRSADPTRQIKFDLSSMFMGGLNSNVNLGPFTPGQPIGTSAFGILKAGVDPYFDISLYQQQSEFGVWPDMTVRFDYSQAGLTPPSVNEVAANSLFGTDCPNENVQSDDLTCSASSFTQFKGARISEGYTFATRNAFPPLLRDDPFVDKMIRILTDCSNDIVPFNNPFFLPVCEIVKPVLACLRRQFTMLVSPTTTSRGKITLFPTGLIDIQANYLLEEADFFSAIRGTSVLIDQLNTDVFEGVLQPFDSPFACPYTVLNGFLDLLTSFGTLSNPLTPAKNVSMLQQYLQSLIPNNYRRLRRLAGEDGQIIEADAENMEKHGIAEKLRKFGLDTDALLEGKDKADEAESEKKTFLPKKLESDETEDDAAAMRSLLIAPVAAQKYATFPPLLPQTTVPVLVGKYAQTYMTSGNSIVNSYPLGSVVDETFNVMGTSNLHVVDQGVLIEAPQIDPAATNMILGVYAAQKIASCT